MIKITMAGTSALSEEAVFQKYLEQLDETRKQKVRQCKKEEDKKRSLLAGYLLQVGVKEQLEKKSGLQADATPLSLSYRYGENGKPYLRDYPNIHFSLSHSGEYVICAFSDHEIGADLQMHRKVREGTAERFFSPEDRALFYETKSVDEAAAFCRIWAVKEAYMKLTGEGMKQGLSSSVLSIGHPGRDAKDCWDRGIIRGESNSAYFRLYDTIEKYSIAVCSNEEEEAEIFWLQI